MKIKNLFNTTSKVLTWVIVFFYIGVMTTSIVLDAKYNIDIEFALGYLQQLMVIIVVSYFGKSAVENFEKIRLSEAHKKQE